MSKRKQQPGCEVDMTPMIDVVFQLIIFFIVTITMSEAKDDTIRLEQGIYGQEIETGEAATSAVVIDINQRGRISIGNTTLTQARLREIIRGRMNRMGNTFQVWIRGDARAQHDMIRNVMDTVTSLGVGRVHFVAIKDARTPEQKEFFARRSRGDLKLEMTPMIDVVFQLLIFFIVTLKQEDILSNLEALRPQPDQSPPKEIQKDPITVLIGRQGFFFEGAILTEAQLKNNLLRIARLDPNSMIIVKCTGDSAHGNLVRALDICNSVGLRELSVFSM